MLVLKGLKLVAVFIEGSQEGLQYIVRLGDDEITEAAVHFPLNFG